MRTLLAGLMAAGVLAGCMSSGTKVTTDVAVFQFDKARLPKSTSTTASQSDVHTELANKQ